MKYTYKKHQAKVYNIRVQEPYPTWANITIREWKGGGSFDCQSDYKDFSHFWNSIGPETLREFLIDLDFDYFMKKTRARDYLEFSGEESLKAVRQDIINADREDRIDIELARKMFDSTRLHTDRVLYSQNTFAQFLIDSDIIKDLYFNDWQAVPIRKEYNPQCLGFWKNIWPAAKEIWEKEITDEKLSRL